MGQVGMKFSNATRHFPSTALGANRRSRVQGYRALKLSLRAEPTGVHRRGGREIKRRLHSLTRPEIAICFLVDATRCLVDDILYGNNSNAAWRPTRPRAHAPTEARSDLSTPGLSRSWLTATNLGEGIQMLIILVSLIHDVPRLHWRCGLSRHGCGRSCEFPGVRISRVDKWIYGRREKWVPTSRSSKAQTLSLVYAA